LRPFRDFSVKSLKHKAHFLPAPLFSMPAKTKLYRFFSLHIWGSLPGPIQRAISKIYASLYDKSFSKHFIKVYCQLNYDDPNYLKSFKPASGHKDYQSFQDFFTRVFKDPPKIISKAVWACEGLLCDYGRVSELSTIKVKGQPQHLRNIFGKGGGQIPDNHYFSNVFLHNNNYHRIHAPASGTIDRIEHIPGELVLLRPWVYPGKPSLPALRNERLNVDIVDGSGQKWFLSIVGGLAVGTIKLTEGLQMGSQVAIGQDIAKFLLGSTCCIASPVPVEKAKVGEQVEMGQPL